MNSLFFVYSYTPLIHAARKEHRWLTFGRAIAATIGIGALLYSLISGSINIYGKEIQISTTSYTSPGEKGKDWMIPNMRICILDDSQTLDDDYDTFNITCLYKGNPCYGIIEKLRGYTKDELAVQWDTPDDIYTPYWQDGFCYHFSTSIWNSHYDLFEPLIFYLNLYTAEPIDDTVKNSISFDVTLFDPRFDPIEVIYNLQNSTTTKKSSKEYGTAIKDFAVADSDFQQSNEYYFNYLTSQSIEFTPYYYQEIRNNSWNYIGIQPLRNMYWTLDTHSTDSTDDSSGNTVCTIKIVASGQGKTLPYTKLETRTYSLIAMVGSLYVLYMAVSNIIFYFFGLYGSKAGLLNVFIDEEPGKRHSKDFGDGDTIPFSNISEKDNGKTRSSNTYDNETLTNRIHNLEAVLAEYYIDINKFRKHVNEEVRPLTVQEKITKFFTGALKQKKNFGIIEKDIKGFDETMGDVEKAFKI